MAIVPIAHLVVAARQGHGRTREEVHRPANAARNAAEHRDRRSSGKALSRNYEDAVNLPEPKAAWRAPTGFLLFPRPDGFSFLNQTLR
jgi:hypothetical protein